MSFLMVTFLVAGNIAEVTDTNPSLCDVESSVLLQFKHKEGRQGMQQLFVPNLDKVFKCNLTATPDFSTDCSDVTTGRIPDGIPFNRAWEVEALPGNGFLVLNQDESLDSPDGDGSIIKCPGVGPCKVLIQGPVAGEAKSRASILRGFMPPQIHQIISNPQMLSSLLHQHV